MKTLSTWLYQVYAWLFFYPFTLVWSFLCGWAAVAGAVLVSQRFGSYRIGKAWAKVIGWLTPMFVRIEGEEHLEEGRSYVVVCNHASQYDIILVYGWLKLDCRWVMKQELRKLPGIGIACEKVGHIIVDRTDPEGAKQTINEALERITDGVGILFFPEGTRSNDGRLRRFKKGAFRIAQDQQLAVLPITLLGTRDILPARSLLLRPGRVRMIIHQAIEPEGRDIRELADLSQAAIASPFPEGSS